MCSERVNLGTTEGQAKVGGTVICVSGAILMVLFHGPALFGGSNQDFVTQTEISERGQLAPAGWLVSSFLELGLDHWMIGTASAWLVFWLSRTIRLFGKAYTLMVEDEVSAHNSCLSYTFRGLISCGKHIRAQVLKEYPASLSVTAYSYFFGAIFIVITTFFMANESTDWSLTESELFAVIYAGAVASAFNHGFMTWYNRISRPALVALYNPIQLVASAILSNFSSEALSIEECTYAMLFFVRLL
ncbi:WAT1-related protein [Citrus sinensis]|nr:WAT1-related protein [Citrus sinensis]